MLNQVVLIGRLTRDPELRYTQAGKAVCDFGLALDRGYNRDETDFFNIVCWERTAESVANNLQKGRLVAINGRLQQDRWEKDGKSYSKVVIVANEVKFLDWPKDKTGDEIF